MHHSLGIVQKKVTLINTGLTRNAKHIFKECICKLENLFSHIFPGSM